MNIEWNGVVVDTIDESSAEVVIDKLNTVIDSIYQDEQIVSEILVDGFNATDDVAGYLSNHLPDIRLISIVSESREAVFLSLLRETLDYIPRLQEAVDRVSDRFYGEPDPGTWTLFGELTQGLQSILQPVAVIKMHVGQYPDAALESSVNKFIADMEKHLGELESHMQGQDFVAAADLMKFEISDSLQELLQALELKMGG